MSEHRYRSNCPRGSLDHFCDKKLFPGVEPPAARRGPGVLANDNSGRGQRTPRGRPRSRVACRRRRRTSPPAARASAQGPCTARCCPRDAFPSMGTSYYFHNGVIPVIVKRKTVTLPAVVPGVASSSQALAHPLRVDGFKDKGHDEAGHGGDEECRPLTHRVQFCRSN